MGNYLLNGILRKRCLVCKLRENKTVSKRKATNFGQNLEERNARITSNLLVREIHITCERTKHRSQLCLIHNQNMKEAKSVFLWFSDY